MKRLIVLAIVFFAAQAYGESLVWDEYVAPSDINGFIAYSQELGTETIYSVAITDPTATEYVIPVECYAPGKSYNFWLTAYNGLAESPKSNIVTWDVPAFMPPTNPPPQIIVIPNSTVTIKIE